MILFLILVIIIIAILCSGLPGRTLAAAVIGIAAAVELWCALSVEGMENAETSGIIVADMPPQSKTFDKPDDPVPWKNQDTDMYDPETSIWDGYRTTYTSGYAPVKPQLHSSAAELDSSMDGRIALIEQKRECGRRITDGWVVKDADYFKSHFGFDLDAEENKPWWGRHEY